MEEILYQLSIMLTWVLLIRSTTILPGLTSQSAPWGYSVLSELTNEIQPHSYRGVTPSCPIEIDLAFSILLSIGNSRLSDYISNAKPTLLPCAFCSMKLTVRNYDVLKEQLKTYFMLFLLKNFKTTIYGKMEFKY